MDERSLTIAGEAGAPAFASASASGGRSDGGRQPAEPGGARGARARVLVVEDEPGIVDFTRRGLEAAGYAVEVALDGIEGERMALSGDFDAIVLDLLLPGRDGREILAALRRARPGLPVIILSALDRVDDRVGGLDAGAADYLVKPFSIAELVARVRAQLRLAEQSQGATLRAGDIAVDLLTRRTMRAGEEVRLSATELDLLVYMMRNRGRVLSREEILGAVWGYEHDPATNIVDVYIGYLRRKLRREGLAAPIATVRSVGYRLEAHGEDGPPPASRPDAGGPSRPDAGGPSGPARGRGAPAGED
jgi:DNA-binding response OmpR family regulator